MAGRPVQSTTIRPITVFTHFHQVSKTSSVLDARMWHQNGCVLVIYPDHRRIQGEVQYSHNLDPEQTRGTWILDKHGDIRDYFKKINRPPGNEHQFQGDVIENTVVQGQGFTTGSCKTISCSTENI
ncbi:hypothetical protein AYI69_g1113 [Smittium culicis]|uniref:Uncharacterized protein n=1 Tax=Smittium culicis TaxID=133412 RepID=A0A1R1YR58_9FUNG|nr:hypothetical protein AYI69_g1113 [Smittium culicis]